MTYRTSMLMSTIKDKESKLYQAQKELELVELKLKNEKRTAEETIDTLKKQITEFYAILHIIEKEELSK